MKLKNYLLAGTALIALSFMASLYRRRPDCKWGWN